MKYREDQGNSRFPDIIQVNQTHVRVYWDQGTEQHEGMDGKTVTIHTGKFIEVEGTFTDPVEAARKQLIDEINAYDTSKAVNSFYMNGQEMEWIPRDDRQALMRRFEAEKSQGKTETTIWQAPNSYTLPIDTAILMMNRLEVYASEAYDRTQQHITAAEQLQTLSACVAYDYTTGYPQKLEF